MKVYADCPECGWDCHRPSLAMARDALVEHFAGEHPEKSVENLVVTTDWRR